MMDVCEGKAGGIGSDELIIREAKASLFSSTPSGQAAPSTLIRGQEVLEQGIRDSCHIFIND